MRLTEKQLEVLLRLEARKKLSPQGLSEILNIKYAGEGKKLHKYRPSEMLRVLKSLHHKGLCTMLEGSSGESVTDYWELTTKGVGEYMRHMGKDPEAETRVPNQLKGMPRVWVSEKGCIYEKMSGKPLGKLDKRLIPYFKNQYGVLAVDETGQYIRPDPNETRKDLIAMFYGGFAVFNDGKMKHFAHEEREFYESYHNMAIYWNDRIKGAVPYKIYSTPVRWFLSLFHRMPQ